MDDLVERLRESADLEDKPWVMQDYCHCDIMREAADRITALQAQLDARDGEIVAWLRELASQPPMPGDTGQAKARWIAANLFADAIERGEYKGRDDG